jgi:uncharacterized protein (TIGR03437 family)
MISKMIPPRRLLVSLAFSLLTIPASAGPLVYVVTGSQQFGAIDLTMGAFSPIGPNTPEADAGLVSGPNGTLLTLTVSGNLDSINPITGVHTVIGPTGLADCSTPMSPCGPTSANIIAELGGTIYATDYQNDLYKVNTATGATTLIGPTDVPKITFVPLTMNSDGTINIFGEAFFSANGKLYATLHTGKLDPSTFALTDVIPNKLYQIDPSTGATTVIGPTGVTLDTVVEVNGTFYGFENSTGTTVTVDLTTGNTTPVGQYNPGNGLIFGAAPVPSPGIINIDGAGFSAPAITTISSNGIFTIFGDGLAAAPQALKQSDIVNNQLPTNLGGTCVESGATKWGLFYVSPGQVNVLAGQAPTTGTVPLTVVTNCGTANEVHTPVANAPVAAVAPEFLYFVQNSTGQNPVAAIDASSGVYIGAPGLVAGATFAPAHAGDVLTAFGVGWGPTTSAAPIGTLASASANLTSRVALSLGGKPADVSYAGLSPESAGLYQINFTVPSGLSAGNQRLVMNVDGVLTPRAAYITIGN